MFFKILLIVAIVFVYCEKHKDIEPVEIIDSIYYCDTADFNFYSDTANFYYISDTTKSFYCPDSLIISHIPTKDYCHFSEDGQIVYVNSEEDTIFHYDMKKQIWIKRKVTTTTALMMIFNLIAGNK